MRRTALAILMLLGLAPVAVGQTLDPTRPHINGVRLGFADALGVGEFKSGAWVPVYVDFTAGREPLTRGEVVIESTDSDDVRNRYLVPLPSVAPGEQVTVLGYTKPGSAGTEIVVNVRVNNQNVCPPFSDNFGAIELDYQIFLAVGNQLGGLRRALRPESDNKPDSDETTKDTGPRRLTSVTRVDYLPTHWFGYDSVDLLFLNTGDRDFLTALLNEREGRKEALVEWVRRGGKLVVSVGSNQDMVAQMEILQPVLPVALKGTQTMPQLRSVEMFAGQQFHRPFENAIPKDGNRRPDVELVKLEAKPGREIETLLTESGSQPVIVRGTYGRGQVTVVGIDLDKPPFTRWVASGQRDFWNNLVKAVAPALPANPGQNQQQVRMGAYGNTENSDIASQLQFNLEKFDDVPVISFGWVAIFILLYIVLVGPLDYLFLKKVVKRLELTWITFPTVVIVISVVAYFTAYWLKGNDQKINKIDVVDVDLQTGQVYGNTWFTIFSPRIQNYTVGLEPVTPVWGPENKGGAPVTLSWMGRPETGWGGTGRGRSQGLFRRAYDYAKDATGLEGVPIQVWSAKSFEASWGLPVDPNQPLLRGELSHPVGRPEAITGQVTSGLKVPLEDVWLYYGKESSGKWYPLGRLAPGVPLRVDNVLAGTEGQGWENWSKAVGESPRTQGPRSAVIAADTSLLMKDVLFHQAVHSQHRDTILWRLDESWRATHSRDAVFLVGRLPREEGPAEDIAQAPASPTRLWLGNLPGSPQPRQPLPGTLAQETYVRVLIPVRPAEGGR